MATPVSAKSAAAATAKTCFLINGLLCETIALPLCARRLPKKPRASLTGAMFFWKELAVHDELAYAAAGLQSRFVGGSKMNAPIDTACARFRRGGGEAGERAHHARQQVGARRKGDVIAAKEARQYDRGCSAESAVSGYVIRKRRRDDQRAPRCIRFRGGVAVQIAIANRRDRPPEIIGILCVPGTNGGISHGKVQQCKEPGVAVKRIAARGRDFPGDAIPMSRWGLRPRAVGPEERN